MVHLKFQVNLIPKFSLKTPLPHQKRKCVNSQNLLIITNLNLGPNTFKMTAHFLHESLAVVHMHTRQVLLGYLHDGFPCCPLQTGICFKILPKISTSNPLSHSHFFLNILNHMFFLEWFLDFPNSLGKKKLLSPAIYLWQKFYSVKKYFSIIVSKLFNPYRNC